MGPSPRPDVSELSLAELEDALESSGSRRFHARQIYRWVYRRGVDDFGRMTDLPRALRERLSSEVDVRTPRIVRRDVSEDGTTKFLLHLADGKLI